MATLDGYDCPCHNHNPMIRRLLNRLSPLDRRLASTFLLAALAAGPLAFFVGQGATEILTASPYQPTLPTANDVDGQTIRARLTPATLAPKAPLLPVAQRATVETEDRGNWIRIASLSVKFPLAVSRTLEDTDVLRALQVGVVRYPNGVAPGQQGVIVVAGHSTGEPWKGRYRFAFLNARKLHPGDLIDVDHNGTRYSYRVTGQRLMNPRQTPQLASAAVTPRLAIITCWPLWTTTQRLIVDAELVGQSQLVYQTPAT